MSSHDNALIGQMTRRHPILLRNRFVAEKNGGNTRPRKPATKWLKKVRVDNDLKQDELAKYLGVSRSTVAMWEKGDNPISPEAIATILTEFPDTAPYPDDSNIQITGEAKAEDRLSLIVYAGVVPCSRDWGEPLESQESRSIEPKFAGTGRFLCRVAGDSCAPALLERDLTIWAPDRDPDWGFIVIAQRLSDGACTVKELLWDAAKGRPILSPVNPSYTAPDDGDGWEVVARLIGVIRRGDGPERTWYHELGLRPKDLT